LERTDNVILGAENFGGNFVDLSDPFGVALNPPNGIKKCYRNDKTSCLWKSRNGTI